MQEVYQRRLDEAQRRMSENDAGLMAIFPGPNMLYFSGIDIEPSERHFLLLIPANQDPVFVAPEIVRDRVEKTGIDSRFWEDSENPREILKQVLDEIGVGKQRVLLDDRMYERFSRDIREITDTEYGIVSEVVRDMRMMKSEDEIENIREASRIVDRIIEDVRDKDVIGMTEEELRDFINEKISEYGGEGPSFETIVAAGENGAKPHHKPTDRKIRAGEPVVLDFGCWKNNYPSDQTRTLVFGGEPSDKFKQVFEVVREAQQKAVEAVRPGIRSDEIDGVARSIIEEAGYGEEFVHRTGHGVGLEIHEHPKVPPAVDEAPVLKEGMVFSVEPGIYLEDEFGVRIEDLVLVTEDGFERLNNTGRDWN